MSDDVIADKYNELQKMISRTFYSDHEPTPVDTHLLLGAANAVAQMLMGERERLRAVADAAREFNAAWMAWREKVERGERVESTDSESRRRAAAVATLCHEVRQLDAAPTGEGT